MIFNTDKRAELANLRIGPTVVLWGEAGNAKECIRSDGDIYDLSSGLYYKELCFSYLGVWL